MGEKICTLFRRLLCILMLLFSGIIIFGILTNKEGWFCSHIPMWEFIVFLLAGTAILFFILSIVFRAINRLNRKGLLIIAAIAALFIISLFVILLINVDSMPYADAATVTEQALFPARNPKAVVSPDSLYGFYFGKYYNNYFIVLLLRGLFMLSGIIRQDFYASGPVDHITLMVRSEGGSDNPPAASLEIRVLQGNIISRGELVLDGSEEGRVQKEIPVTEFSSSARAMYSLYIIPPEDNTAVFYRTNRLALDAYEGQLYIDGAEQEKDLFLSVYNIMNP